MHFGIFLLELEIGNTVLSTSLIKGMSPGARVPGSNPSTTTYYRVTRTSCVTSLCLGFLICKTGVMLTALWGQLEELNEFIIKSSEYCLAQNTLAFVIVAVITLASPKS